MNIEEIKLAISNGETMKSLSKRPGIPFSTFKRKLKKLGMYVPNQGRRGINRPKDEIDRTEVGEEE